MAYIHYPRLAKHLGLWRVDGIGEIHAYSEKSARLTVHFSGINEDDLSKPYLKNSHNDKYVGLKAHPSSISDFRVGTIWQGGNLIHSPKTIKTYYEIDPSKMQLYKLSEEFHINGQKVNTILPESHFKLGKNRKALSETLYALVPVINNVTPKWLIIPASEILRFYSGAGDITLDNAFRGILDRYVDWSKCKRATDGPILYRKQHIKRNNYLALFRAIASKKGTEALYCTKKHLAAIDINNKNSDSKSQSALVIKSCFPFDSSTFLSVTGKRVPLTPKDKEGNQIWALFAFEICHCTHPAGFTNPIVFNEYKTDKAAPGIPFRNPQGHIKTPVLDEDSDPELEDKPSDKTLKRLAIRRYENRFSATQDIKYEHIRKYQPKHKSSITSDIEAIKALSQDEGSYSKDAKGNLGIDNSENDDHDVCRDLTHFIETLNTLSKLIKKDEWDLSTIKLTSSKSENNTIISYFPYMTSLRYKWHLIDIDETNKSRPRQIIVAKIRLKDKDQCLYILEMELKPNENGQCTILVHGNKFSPLTITIFEELLKLTTVHNRWPHEQVNWYKGKSRKSIRKANKLKDRARLLFESINVARIGHPNRIKSKVDDKHQDADKSKDEIDNKKEDIDIKSLPEKWAESLLDRIQEVTTSNQIK